MGRWHVQDALAEKYHSISSYAYVGNNPLNLIDLLGLDWYSIIGNDRSSFWFDSNEDYIERGNLSYYRRGEGRVEGGLVYWSPDEFELFDRVAYESPDSGDRRYGYVFNRKYYNKIVEDFYDPIDVASNGEGSNAIDYVAYWTVGIPAIHSGAIAGQYMNSCEYGSAALWTGVGIVEALSLGSFKVSSFFKTPSFAVKTSTSLIDDVVIQFGKNENQIYHVFRHTDALGLNRSLVQSTVQNHFKTVSSQVVAGRPFNQVVEIAGHRIQYTAFKLPNGIFNIGRIHGL